MKRASNDLRRPLGMCSFTLRTSDSIYKKRIAFECTYVNAKFDTDDSISVLNAHDNQNSSYYSL